MGTESVCRSQHGVGYRGVNIVVNVIRYSKALADGTVLAIEAFHDKSSCNRDCAMNRFRLNMLMVVIGCN